jgi:xanthine dehydrogenase molybdopterin-binding subunit B
VLGSKATGEPSVLMGVSALLAIRHAIAAAKKDLGEDPKAWFNLCKTFFIILTLETVKSTDNRLNKTNRILVYG